MTILQVLILREIEVLSNQQLRGGALRVVDRPDLLVQKK
jgi:hypothetical protein